MVSDEFLSDIIAKEGGYSNKPKDAGGETMYGITVAVARKYGYQGDMKKLPLSLAKQIYKELYWDSLRLTDVADLSPAIALSLADIGVNMGIGRAGEFFQRLLNTMNKEGKIYPDIKVDGSVGTKTIASFRSYMSYRGHDGDVVMVRLLNCLKGEYYVSLAERRQTDEEFIFGWGLNRIS